MIVNSVKKKLLHTFCTSSISPYKILQVNTTASQQQIKIKYYELAQKYHPDHDPTFTQKFKVINQAYQILKDPEKRRQLDYQLLNKKNLSVKYDFSKSNRHHYGHTYTKQKFTQEDLEVLKKRASQFMKPGYQAQNPGAYFDFGFNPNKGQSGEKKRQNHARLKQQQHLIRSILTGGFILLSLFATVQLVFKVYEFNTKSHKKDQQILKKSKRIKQKQQN